jgi:carbon storage regulator
MLVLTRKPGESVVVPEYDVTITVLHVSGKKVRIGITAPPSVMVYRHEVCERVRAASANGAGSCRRARETMWKAIKRSKSKDVKHGASDQQLPTERRGIPTGTLD